MLDLFSSRAEAARIAGRSDDQLHAYTKGSEPPFSAIARLAAAKGVTIDWIWTGRGEMMAGAHGPGLAEEASPFGLTRVPVYELRLSAGSGEPSWANEQPREFLDLPTEYVAKTLRLNPTYAAAFPVAGDSMQPTIHDGELAVMDRSERSIDRDGAIYVLRRGDGLMIKRVFRRGGGFLLKSDNPTFGEEQVPRSEWDEIQILGRVGGALRRV